ncbi:MAG: PD-(D/E)XK nuclease family protein [Tannerella sp.]|jgi:hypothetical protein|nr:PD-(D/E)XK nuclease family protein [Tannerella sp.]
MKPFLQQVAELFYGQYGTDVQHIAFVFPNRRAGLFFRKHLSHAAKKPVFAPVVLTINELFMQLSDKQPADRIKMLFKLFAIYRKHSNPDETFDDFVFWGDTLIADFDEVDKHLVDARQLFTNITELHEMEKDFSYLSDEQVAAIRSFWSGFNPEKDSSQRQQFLKIWKLLYPIYVEFRETLAAEGIGYEGMIFREIIERAERSGQIDFPYSRIVFVGLNALSTVEKKLLLMLKNQGVADFYWDYSSPLINDGYNKAAAFAKDNQSRFPSQLKLPVENFTLPRTEVIGVPSRIGQTKQLYSLLHNMLNGRLIMDDEEALRTAIVLPDEKLLIPTLHSIPNEIGRINVTLGYPLYGSPVASFVDTILQLHKNIRIADGQCSFYHRETLTLLNHQYIKMICKDTSSVIKDINKHNKVYINAKDLVGDDLTKLIFSTVNNINGISDYLIEILQMLENRISELKNETGETSHESISEIEQEFIYHYITTLNRMKDMIREEGIEMTVDTYHRLLKRITEAITIPFYGEPLSGLQIMGVLETRVLDFDNVIILSANENIFPPAKSDNSFIPYNLRKGFDLPTYEYRDSIRAYHFYRMISRAQQVTMLYDTRNTGIRSGEVSRYVHQLRYHYKAPISDKLVVCDIASSKPADWNVEKSDKIMAKMAEYWRENGKALSASAINKYLNCPLSFYFTFVEGIREEDEVAETIQEREFGNIFHKVMELIYSRMCGTQVTADILKLAAQDSNLTAVINRAFDEAFFHTGKMQQLTGQHYLTAELIRKYAKQLLKRDIALTPFRYVASEQEIKRTFELTDGKKVNFKGYIDRIDEVSGTTRIIDFKTGSHSSKIKSPEMLFDRTEKNRPGNVFQIFAYSMMYSDANNLNIQPLIYYLRDIFSDDFDPAIYIDNTPVTDFANIADEFKNQFRKCLDEIFDPAVPFVQAADETSCSYCQFLTVCGRKKLAK